MSIWQKKSIEDLQNSPDVKSPKFKRSLSAFDLVLMGIGVIVGAGLFSIMGVAAAENAGPAIVISFILAACGCAFAGLCYSELATMIPLSGSTYTYTYAAMGELPAWIIGWSLVLEYIIGAATVSISWSAYALSFLQDFNISFPTVLSGSSWQPMTLPDGSTVTGFINLPALVIVIIFAKLHPIYQTPWYSNLILMMIVGTIASFGSIELMSHLTSIGTLLAFTIVCCGVIILRYTHPETPRPFKTPFFPLVPILGVVTCFSMMLCLGLFSWLRLIGWMAIGAVIYFTYSRHRIAKLQDVQKNTQHPKP